MNEKASGLTLPDIPCPHHAPEDSFPKARTGLWDKRVRGLLALRYSKGGVLHARLCRLSAPAYLDILFR